MGGSNKQKNKKAAPVKGKPKHSLDEGRRDGKNGTRTAATVRRLKMYKSRPVRNSKGHILSNEYQSKALPTTRIQPDRRWFGNTRVVGQKELETFREEMRERVSDSYTVILKDKKLPLALLNDNMKVLSEFPTGLICVNSARRSKLQVHFGFRIDP